MSVSATEASFADAARAFGRWWWLWLLAGIFWIVAAFDVLAVREPASELASA